jgi:PASTA domain
VCARRAGRELSKLSRRRTTVVLRVLAATAVASVVLVAGGCGGTAQEAATTAQHKDSAAGTPSAVVPNVIGLSEAEAVKALGAAGFIANVRLQKDAPRSGEVLSSAPTAGIEAAENAVVVLEVSLPPRRPLPEPEHEQNLHPLSTLVENNADAFVGIYIDEAGIPHAVFGPDADTASWTERLQAAAGNLAYRTDTCERERHSLRAIQDEITANRDWMENGHLAFGVGVDPGSCTVRVESDLLAPAEIAALVARYSTAVSFDTTEGSHPILLPLTDS